MNDQLARLRTQLREIPEMLALVGQYIRPGSRPPDPDARRATGTLSRPPLVLDVVDLQADLKDGWLGWRPGDDVQYQDQNGWRHGIRGTLWLWNFMLEQEMTDTGRTFTPCDSEDAATIAGWLAFHLEWVVENHGRDNGDFAGDIRRMYRALQHACGIRPEQAYVCPQCRGQMFLDEQSRFLVCQDGTGHDISVENLELRWRRRPPKTTKEIVAEFPGVTSKQLYNAARGPRPKITPVDSPDGLKWFPFDVLKLLNPSLAEAFSHQDQLTS